MDDKPDQHCKTQKSQLARRKINSTNNIEDGDTVQQYIM